MGPFNCNNRSTIILLYLESIKGEWERQTWEQALLQSAQAPGNRISIAVIPTNLLSPRNQAIWLILGRGLHHKKVPYEGDHNLSQELLRRLKDEAAQQQISAFVVNSGGLKIAQHSKKKAQESYKFRGEPDGLRKRIRAGEKAPQRHYSSCQACARYTNGLPTRLLYTPPDFPNGSASSLLHSKPVLISETRSRCRGPPTLVKRWSGRGQGNVGPDIAANFWNGEERKACARARGA